MFCHVSLRDLAGFNVLVCFLFYFVTLSPYLHQSFPVSCPPVWLLPRPNVSHLCSITYPSCVFKFGVSLPPVPVRLIPCVWEFQRYLFDYRVWLAFVFLTSSFACRLCLVSTSDYSCAELCFSSGLPLLPVDSVLSLFWTAFPCTELFLIKPLNLTLPPVCICGSIPCREPW